MMPKNSIPEVSPKAPTFSSAVKVLEVTGAAPSLKLGQFQSEQSDSVEDGPVPKGNVPLSSEAVLIILDDVRESVERSRVAVSVLLSYQSFRPFDEPLAAKHVQPFVEAIEELDGALGEYRKVLKAELRAHKEFITKQ